MISRVDFCWGGDNLAFKNVFGQQENPPPDNSFFDMIVRITARVPKPRSVPLGKEAEEIIERQLHLHPHSKNVFLNTEGQPYSKSGIFHRLQRWCNKIGIKGTVDGLRHTFGTMQGVCKTNQAVLAQLMGHSSLQTTSRYMANVSAAHRQTVMDREAILNNKPENGSPECKTDAKPGQNLSPKEKTSKNTAAKISASH